MSTNHYHPLKSPPPGNTPEQKVEAGQNLLMAPADAFAEELASGPHGGVRSEQSLQAQHFIPDNDGVKPAIVDFTPALLQDLHTALEAEDAGDVVPRDVVARINNATPLQLAKALRIGQKLPFAYSVEYRKGLEAGLIRGQVERDELVRALKRVAFEPQGPAEASDRFVLDAVTQIARDALEAAEKGGSHGGA